MGLLISRFTHYSFTRSFTAPPPAPHTHSHLFIYFFHSLLISAGICQAPAGLCAAQGNRTHLRRFCQVWSRSDSLADYEKSCRFPMWVGSANRDYAAHYREDQSCVSESALLCPGSIEHSLGRCGPRDKASVNGTGLELSVSFPFYNEDEAQVAFSWATARKQGMSLFHFSRCRQ